MSGEDKEFSDDEIGYQIPPRNTEYPLGQTRNPKDRSHKGKRKSFLDDAAMELEVKVPIMQNGKKTKITKKELAARTLVNKALNKDPKALAHLMKLLLSQEQNAREEKTHKPNVRLIWKNWKNWKNIDGTWKLVGKEE